jgi:hypothetical protein
MGGVEQEDRLALHGRLQLKDDAPVFFDQVTLKTRLRSQADNNIGLRFETDQFLVASVEYPHGGFILPPRCKPSGAAGRSKTTLIHCGLSDEL